MATFEAPDYGEMGKWPGLNISSDNKDIVGPSATTNTSEFGPGDNLSVAEDPILTQTNEQSIPSIPSGDISVIEGSADVEIIPSTIDLTKKFLNVIKDVDKLTIDVNNKIRGDAIKWVFDNNAFRVENSKELSKLRLNLHDLRKGQEFYIRYYNPIVKGYVIYYFALSPAIQSHANARGQVPEIKPGILIRSSMNIKHFSLPGTDPAYQIMGRDPTILQLTGMLVGTEITRDSHNVSLGQVSGTDFGNIYQTDRSKPLNAHETANILQEQVIKSGLPVNIVIRSKTVKTMLSSDMPINIVFTAILQNLRLLIRGSDKAYYAIDALILSQESV